LSEAGTYGLALGAVGIAPAAIGWGLNYFTAREVVGLTPTDAVNIVKARLFVTICSLALLSLISIALTIASDIQVSPIWAAILILICLETIALDLYLPMIGLEMAAEANVIVFVRSGLWIPLVVAAGLVWPETRTLAFLFGSWIAGHLLSLLLFAWYLRHWPITSRIRKPVDYEWIRTRLLQSWYIYVSDLGIVSVLFLERYVVSWRLGLAATGIYTFYWSICNALQTLMQTSVIQLMLPRMIRGFSDPDASKWRRLLKLEMIKVVTLSCLLGMAMWLVVQFIFYFDELHVFPREQGLLALLLGAAVMRSGSDFLNICLTSAGKDRYYAGSNIVGGILAVLFAYFFISIFGLVGVGIASAATALMLIVSRFTYLQYAMSR
jgi:O-antigen/teichoic acid export membrane protein